MRKFLSIFMSLVMVVTMLPKVSFAEEPPVQQNEECAVGGVRDNFFQFVNFVKEKAPQAWEKIKPYVEQGKSWGKDYYKNVSEFASKVGVLGVAATVGLSALVVKVGWKILKFIVALFSDEDDKQAGHYNSNSTCSMDRGKPITYTYSTGGYQTPCSYGYVN